MIIIDDGPVFVTCPECGYEQGDAGEGVCCEECGHAPMPTGGDDDDEAGN